MKATGKNRGLTPFSGSKDPSRTTVDQYGNVWVANRDEVGFVGDVEMGSITRIGLVYGAASAWKKDSEGKLTRDDPFGNYLKGPFAYNTCLDRNGDGYIRTSRGKTSAGIGDILPWSNTRNGSTEVDTLGGVSTAEDEAITEFVRVVDFETRTIAVDRFNDIWVGGTGQGIGKHEKVDGLLGAVVPNSRFAAGCGGYGGFINMDGALWSARASVNNSSLLRFVPPTTFPPNQNDWQCLSSDGGNYGLAIDPTTGEVWHTWDHTEPGQISRWALDGSSFTTFSNHGWPCAQGVVVDANGNVWVAHARNGRGCDDASHIGHLRTDGTFIGNVDLTSGSERGEGPTGLSVDSQGKIWVTCYDSNDAWRIDPTTGAVDLPPVDLGTGISGYEPPFNVAAGPYNYSDMTGFHNRIANPGGCPLKGYWNVIENGGSPDRLWSVSWVANTPPGTGARVEVYARAADDRLALSNKRFVQVANGSSVIPGVRGQYLEVRTLLARETCAQEPYLENLTICSLSKTLTLLNPPTDQTVLEGNEGAFDVLAIGTEPLTYEWSLTKEPGDANAWWINGLPVGPNRSVFSLPQVDCLDSGRYTVRITDGSGDVVEAGPAYLNVVPRTVVIPLVGSASTYPIQIVVSGAPTSISSVEIVLNGFKHERPDDLDILLVPPSPAPAIMLMSDAGGSTPVEGLTLSFSKDGSLLSDDGELSTGTFRLPANFGEAETAFPASNPTPPASPYSTDLTLLNEINPNGTWSLYIVDDTNQRSGFVSGSWCLILKQ